MTDLSDFEAVRRVVRSDLSVREGMNALLQHCAARVPSPAWEQIGERDFHADVAVLHDWLSAVLTAEPPADDVAAYWFGLFEAEEKVGIVRAVLYLCGSGQYDPFDPKAEWAVNPAYFPEGRFAESTVLRGVYRHAPMEGDEAVYDVGSYVLGLGYAALAVRELLSTVDRRLLLGGRTSRGVAVGWDSGDALYLESVQSTRPIH